MAKTLNILLLIFLLPIVLVGQEFMINVSVNSRQVDGTERKVFQTLQQDLYEFVNSRNWTNHQFRPEERIEGSISITIDERISGDHFKGRINVMSKRPIYKSSYYSTLLNIQDTDFEFKYIEYEPIEYIENTFTSNLAGVVAYYLYIILGFDFDSFSPYGGTPYFEKARNIVNAAQNSNEAGKGWKAFEGIKNRYWLVENLLNSSHNKIRSGLYKYHLQGLDKMSENIELGRSAINEFMEDLQETNRSKQGLYSVQVVLDAKRDEIVNIYSQAPPMDKSRAVNILKEIDPANTSKYQQILKQK
ncbi:MAG: DUF4835 family protein [Lentimicrobiaceae bacterium]|nr:DUF4835 family protein [Lentimicrobiaceae bacterium]